MLVPRRQFIQTTALAASALPAALRAAGKRLPIGFSTLGCPAWDWLKILDFAQQNGFAAVELRGLQGNMDLPSRPEFSSTQIAHSKKDVAARGLHLACLGSSANMHDTDPQKHEQQLSDARRFIDLASTLEVPYVRVFGNKLVGPREQALEQIAASLQSLGQYAGAKNVTVLIESHGDFTDSPSLREILEKSNSPHVGLLWDAHHTFVTGKEDPAVTVRQLGKYIRHTHLKDSRVDGDQIHYVLTGRGHVPVREQVQALRKTGYQGYYSFEWEKVWHPEIEEPEVAFADFARVISEYF
ncbi:MAG TPA: sugar phosphate isomerase/epimerase family protein [Candidatus Dormibacteraeota bacterium]|nr:sugar phosphate isomerase/epimerase family protein [Candidatus Dormibacteraeota bacterium]